MIPEKGKVPCGQPLPGNAKEMFARERGRKKWEKGGKEGSRKGKKKEK